MGNSSASLIINLEHNTIFMTKRNWTKTSSEEILKTPFFSVSKNTFKDNFSYNDYFYRFNFTDWVNIVPELDRETLIMIKIYRFGIEGYSLEFPGGQVDRGDSPMESAKKELIEETGYKAESLDLLSWVHPNPAIQNNKCFLYLAKNIDKVSLPELEEAEDISICKVPKAELPKLIAEGKITHTLSLLAYFYSELIGK